MRGRRRREVTLWDLHRQPLLQTSRRNPLKEGTREQVNSPTGGICRSCRGQGSAVGAAAQGSQGLAGEPRAAVRAREAYDPAPGARDRAAVLAV